jgi:hypothetical protein
MPTRTADLKSVDEETVRTAVADLGTDIIHLREQTRQADAKAGTVLTVVGLVLAAATAVLPRLGGAGLVLAAIALVLVVATGPLLGAAVLPRPGRGHPWRPGADDIIDHAFGRVRDPHGLLIRRANEVSALIAVASLKHRLVRAALLLLSLAFIVATAAAATVAVAALI